MASSAKQVSLFLLLITLSSSLHTHARDSQFFNKISAASGGAATTTTTNVVPDAKQPTFLPQNENTYGLYSRDSAHLPPSTTTAAATVSSAVEKPIHDHFPKNYNPVAYVTEAEDFDETPAFKDVNSFTSIPNNNNYFYTNGGGGGGWGFNGRPQRFNRGGVQPQGMSDTRFMENGKYFYDVNADKYGRNHAYAGMREDRARNEFYNDNFYGNNRGNVFENNLRQDEFDDEDDEVKALP